VTTRARSPFGSQARPLPGVLYCDRFFLMPVFPLYPCQARIRHRRGRISDWRGRCWRTRRGRRPPMTRLLMAAWATDWFPVRTRWRSSPDILSARRVPCFRFPDGCVRRRIGSAPASHAREPESRRIRKTRDRAYSGRRNQDTDKIGFIDPDDPGHLRPALADPGLNLDRSGSAR
jgi:hypothetical protein